MSRSRNQQEEESVGRISNFFVKEVFQIYQAVFDKGLDMAIKNAAIAAVVLGWVVTSAETGDLLKEHPAVRRTGTVVMILYAVLHMAWIYGFRMRSTKLRAILLSHEEADEGVLGKALDQYSISLGFCTGVVSIHLLMTAVILVVILRYGV